MHLFDPSLSKWVRIVAYLSWVLVGIGIAGLGYAILSRSVGSLSTALQGTGEATSTFTQQAKEALK